MMLGRINGLFLVTMVLLQSSCTQPKAPERKPDLKGLADETVVRISEKNFPAAVTHFDATMVKALPPEKLEEAWQSVIQSLGSFQKTTGHRVASEQGYDVVYVQCQFEKGKIDAKVVFNADAKVSGLFFVPAH